MLKSVALGNSSVDGEDLSRGVNDKAFEEQPICLPTQGTGGSMRRTESELNVYLVDLILEVLDRVVYMC